MVDSFAGMESERLGKLVLLGRTKYNENRFAEAVSAVEQCLKLDPKNVKAEDNLGLSFAGLGRNEEAATAYQTAIAWQSQLLVKNPGPYIDLEACFSMRTTDEAISNLFQAGRDFPSRFQGHEILGKAYARLISCEGEMNWKKRSNFLRVPISIACWPPSIESRELTKGQLEFTAALHARNTFFAGASSSVNKFKRGGKGFGVVQGKPEQFSAAEVKIYW